MGSITEAMKTGKIGTPSQKWGAYIEKRLNESPKHAKSYAKELEAFRVWLCEKLEIDASLDDLYQWAVESDKTTIVNDTITDYLNHLATVPSKRDNKSKTGYGKLKEAKSSIYKFFALNGIVYTVQKNSELAELLHRATTDKRKPSSEEIKQLIALCPNYRLKSAVALSKDSGLRVSDIVQVQYKHIKDGLNSVDGFGGFSLKTEKTEKQALPLFGAETTQYLKCWVEELERNLGRNLADEDYIFPTVMNYGDTKPYEKLDAGTLSQLINNQIDKLGLKGEISANGLRYFFQSQLETKLNKNIILKIQGKSIGDSSGAYSKHDIAEMLEIYKPVYHLLAVESDTLANAKTDSLALKVKALEQELGRALRHITELESDRPEPEQTEPPTEPEPKISITQSELMKLINQAIEAKEKEKLGSG